MGSTCSPSQPSQVIKIKEGSSIIPIRPDGGENTIKPEQDQIIHLDVEEKQEEKQPPNTYEFKTLSTTMSITKDCIICKKSIGNNDLHEASYCKYCKQTECHSYHIACFEKNLEEQINNKGKHLLTFKCGTLIKTQQLRNSRLNNKMNLLAKLFDQQIEYCLMDSKIRKDQELINYNNEQRANKEARDYFLIKQEFLEYTETPQ